MAINKVLIVDDSETELVNLKNIVSAAGAVVLLARSGNEAVQKAKAEQPDLTTLADQLGYSEGFIQRTFQAYAGLSPKQFLRMLTREKALERLSDGANVLDAALDSGLSGPGRLHDLLISTDAMTPGEARRRGAGVIRSSV